MAMAINSPNLGQVFNDLFSAIPLSVITTDPKGHIVSYNQMAEEMFSLVSEDQWSSIFKMMSARGSFFKINTMHGHKTFFKMQEMVGSQMKKVIYEVSIKDTQLNNIIYQVYSFKKFEGFEAPPLNEGAFASVLQKNVFFENDFLGFIICDEAGIILDLNSAFSKMIGYRKHELIGMPFDFVIPEHAIPFESKPFSGKEFNASIFQQTTFTRKDQNPLHVLVQRKNRINEFGASSNIIIVQDITPRQAMEQALEASENHYQKLFEDNLLGMVLINNEGMIHQSNQAFRKLFGYNQRELKNIGIGHLTEQTDADKTQKIFEGIVNGMTPSVVFEKVCIRKNQKLVNCMIYLRALYNDDGDFLYIIGSILDLSPIKKTELALTRTEEKYKALFDNAFEGIAMYDLKKKKNIVCNKQFMTLFGIKKKETFKKLEIKDFCPLSTEGVIDPLEDLRANFKKALTDGSNKFEWVGKHTDDSLLPLEITSIRANNGEEDILINLFKDISEEKRQERTIQEQIDTLNNKNQELERYIASNQELENFAYIASHDIKAPLRTISGFSQLLEKSAFHKLDEQEKQFMTFIRESSGSLQTLIDDLLHYSQANNKEKEPQFINIKSLVEKILIELHVDIKEKQADIQLHNLPDNVLADPTKMKQLFQNLISNAMKFTKKGEAPKINITFKKQGNEYLFSVADNGIGIKPEFYDKVFFLFRKLNSPAKFKGSGIGLALCKKIIDQHHGRIWIESEFDKGTTFNFAIPVSFKDERN